MNRPTRAPAPPSHPDLIETHAPLELPAMVNRSLASEALGNRPAPTFQVGGYGQLAAAIAAVMAEIKPVEKSGWNDFHKYKYAKMQDLVTELTPLMGKHGIVIFQNEVDRSMFDDDRVICVRYEFTIAHKSGEVWPERPLMTGMSRCRDNKGGFDDKSFNKAHTAARKYFLISLFQIPTEDEDDADRQQQRPPAPAPRPDGKVPPHMIQFLDGETPAAWAQRFVRKIEKATPVEVDAWYNANLRVFERLKDKLPVLYDDLVGAMDDIANGKAPVFPARTDPVSSGPAPAKPRTKAPAPTINISEQEWLDSLRDAFSGCEDIMQLQHAQEQYMMGQKDKVGGVAWNKAVDLAKAEATRIQDQK